MDDLDGRSKDRLVRLWEAKRRGRPMPARADFDVIADLRPFLGNLILAETVESGRDWRFRVFGSTIAARIDEERQGKRVSEIPAEEASRLRAIFTQVVQSRSPAEADYPLIWQQLVWSYKILALPLSDDGENINMVLSLIFLTQRRQAACLWKAS